MVASAAMTIGKFIVGFMTGSLGLISEALHSFLDFWATVLTFMTVRVSDKPADEEHPYGHGKIEAVAALAETALLFITSFWVIYEAVRRLRSGEIEVEATWWSIAVVVASIVIDYSRARALKKVADETRSQALAADALHFSSDILSSFVVLLGLGFVAMGWPIGDPIAAIGVSIFVCHAGWVLGRDTIDTLIDVAPSGAVSRVIGIVEDVEGVAQVERVRARPSGSLLFVDLDLSVGRSLTQAQVVAVRQKVAAAMKKAMPEADVSIATHPLALDTETVYQRITAIANNREAKVHRINVHHSDDLLFVTLSLQVEEGTSIRTAHIMASCLEADIRTEFGEATEVETHIEPFQDKGTRGHNVDAETLAQISKILEGLVDESKILERMHNLRVRRTERGLVVIFHCRTAPERTVAEVHKTVDVLELKLRLAYPGIWSIIAHAEPDMADDGDLEDR